MVPRRWRLGPVWAQPTAPPPRPHPIPIPLPRPQLFYSRPQTWEPLTFFTLLYPADESFSLINLWSCKIESGPLFQFLQAFSKCSLIWFLLLQVMDFNEVMVAVFIATIGLLSVGAQMILGVLMKQLGSKHTIMVGLLFEMLQLMWYGFGSQMW